MKLAIKSFIGISLIVLSFASLADDSALKETLADKDPVLLSETEMDNVTAGAPWFVWMGVGALGAIVLDTHTDLLGEAGHGCRGINCNNRP